MPGIDPKYVALFALLGVVRLYMYIFPSKKVIEGTKLVNITKNQDSMGNFVPEKSVEEFAIIDPVVVMPPPPLTTFGIVWKVIKKVVKYTMEVLTWFPSPTISYFTYAALFMA